MTEKRKRRADDTRRAGLYLKQLAWLEGAPVDRGWWHLDTDEVLALDGARISRARRTARTLLREHHDELGDLVGDVDRWWQIVDAKLAACSAATGGARAAAFQPEPFMTPRLTRTLSDLRAGALRDAATAIATAWLADLGRVEQGLEWLAEHEAALAALGTLPHIEAGGLPRLTHALAQLALAGAGGKAAAARRAGVGGLLALLAIDAPDAQGAVDLTRNLESRLLRHREKHPVDVPRSGARVVRWTLELAQRDVARRQRTLALLGTARLADALTPWDQWRRQHEALFARAAELAGVEFDPVERARHVGRMVQRLTQAREAAPHPISVAELLLDLDMLAGERLIRFHASIVRLLRALPAELPAYAPARMLLHLARNAATAADEDHLEWLWEDLASALEGGAAAATLRPWGLERATRSWLDFDLVHPVRRRTQVASIVRQLATWARERAPTESDAHTIGTWIAAGLPEGLVLEVVAELRDAITTLEDDVARTAVVLADGSAIDAATLARAMHTMVADLPGPAVHHIAALAEHAASSDMGWLVRGALLANQRALLVETAELMAALPASRRPRLDAPGDTAWIRRYPPPLATALQRLATVTPEAERVAARRLSPDLRAPAELEREITTLQARPATASTTKRLANLRRQLTAPTQPSPRRLANLAARVEATARELGLTRLGQEAAASSRQRLLRALHVPSWPDWAEPADRGRASQLRAILHGLAGLDEPERALAGRLLRARSEPPPWDLRDDPANRAFLERMRSAGLDPAPWLDPSPQRVHTGRGGSLELALCADPLDVFAMGAHFDTCLSPDGGNFFSVVANAADINKRVVYARQEGRVVGRCLLAITDTLTLLTFHPYCHLPIDFAAVVRDFASGLATRIGLTLAARGSVPTLVARQWYDDGARDLAGQFAGLERRLVLDAAPADELVPRLRAALGRDLDDVTLPLVLGLRELRQRPRLLAPLVPFVLASHAPALHVDAAQIAFAHGDLALADRLLGEHEHAVRIEDQAWPQGELVARLRPSRTLARLRRSRPRHVRRWSDDHGDRVALAGVALLALERPHQAAAMFRLAARESWLAEDMHTRLHAMGAPLEGDVAG